jgi:hypothetical protein
MDETMACHLPVKDRAQWTADFRALFADAFIDRARVPDGVRWRVRALATTEADSLRASVPSRGGNLIAPYLSSLSPYAIVARISCVVVDRLGGVSGFIDSALKYRRSVTLVSDRRIRRRNPHGRWLVSE